MPEWVVGKLVDALNERGKALKGAKILILGIAYKKNVDDARESPSIKIMEILRHKGAILAYSDPYIPSFPKMRDHKFNLLSIKLTEESLERYDAIILATDHDAFDRNLILNQRSLVIDTRNTLPSAKNIIKA